MSRALIIAYTTYIYDGRVKRHAEALAQRGDEVDVLCLAGRSDVVNGVNLIGLKMPRYRGSSRTSYMGSYLRFFAMAATEAARRSLKRPYDVVIVCTMPDAAVLCAVPARLFGSKVVLDVHDTMPELYSDKFGGRRGSIGARLLMTEERMSAWMADRVLAVHDLHRERLKAAGIPAEKIKVVVNSPDPSIFSPLDPAPVDSKDFVLVCHGTVAHRLGLDLVLEAVLLLRERIPNLKLMVAGGGDYLPTVKELCSRLGLDDRVKFFNSVPIEQLPRLLSAAHVGLVPNRASSATHLMLPVKLLEYAALGIPVIASRLKTIEYYFGNDAVRYFEPDDAQSLAAAIEEFYLKPDRRIEFARSAKQVAWRLGWQHQRECYLQAIDSLIGPHSLNGKSENGGDHDHDNVESHEEAHFGGR